MEELTLRNGEKKPFLFTDPSGRLLGEKYDLLSLDGVDVLSTMLDCSRENEMKLRIAEGGEERLTRQRHWEHTRDGS